MRVHVVCRDHTSERIIPLLASSLISGTGWSISAKPDPKADINYAFPYLEMPENAWPGTRTAALFSHHETTVPNKAAVWTRLAPRVDLRLTWAKLYADKLSVHGATRRVTPPLDREKFRPEPDGRARSSEAVIGVSGWVYPGGRKGEQLVAALAQESEKLGVKLIATGEGWPCPMVTHNLSNLHEFYWRLDAYLCTSLIEGIPYPPLEALACGVPVIIPTGVGMMDELPDMPGIVHYRAADYPDMKRAIGRLLRQRHTGQIEPERLRASTAPFTQEAWVNNHLAALEELDRESRADLIISTVSPTISPGSVASARSAPVTPPRPRTQDADQASTPVGVLPSSLILPPPSSDWRGRAGVYYVAYGDPARACAVRAIASLKRWHPELPCCLVSDRALDAGEDIFVEIPDTDIGGRGAKTRIYELTPPEWDYVLYLDADTEIIAPLDHLFAVLSSGWDIVFCPNPPKYARAADMRRPDNQDECEETFAEIGTDELLQFNGGVFGFKRGPQTANFCLGWHLEWQRYGKRDQAALDRVLYRDPLRVWVLSTHYNRVDRYQDADARTVIVHHPTEARRHTGVIKGRLDSPEAWMAVGVKKGKRR